MGRAAAAIALSEEERRALDGLARRRSTAQGLARRAQIVLLAAEGLDSKTIAQRLGVVENTVGKWRRRFARHRLDGLYDAFRPGRPREISDEEIAETIRLTLETTPGDATHWSLRSMAHAVGHSPSTIHRIWQAFGLQPHRMETFRLSRDPLFIEKLGDIVGLYMAPSERAIVLCVNEKSQVQALDRGQPIPGQPDPPSHDQGRYGTSSLFAALDAATGKTIGRCCPRHRSAGVLKFLRAIDANVPADLDVHLVLDNHATHEAPAIRKWLAVRPRWHVHLTPTSALWINQAERFFADLTGRQIRRGVDRSTRAL